MNRRRLPVSHLALLLLALVISLGAAGAVATGSDPSEGTVGQQNTTVMWDGKTLVGGGTGGGCNTLGGSAPNCDEYKLTVDLDEKYWEAYNGGVKVEVEWEDTADNFNVAVYDNKGAQVATAAATGGEREELIIPEPSRAGSPYRILTYLNNAGDEDVAITGTYKGAAQLQPIAAVPDGGGGAPGAPIPTTPVSGAPCTDGIAAGVFPCKDVDLESFLPLTSLTLEGDEPGQLNDIWGWTDPQTGKEYAIVGKTNGTSFVDVSDPRAPRYLGDLPTRNVETDVFNIWRDMKVYKNHAFIVSEEPLHGMQVFDLTRLRDVTSPQRFDEDATYDGFGSAHNIALNEQSGFAYAIGSRTCGGGSHIVDVRDPQSPKPAGCVAQDLYTHDNQCVTYDGPDTRFTGREICFDYNEDSLTIVDVTNKALPRQLSKLEYEGSSYTHQGWLTADKRFALANDELDEQDSDVPTTTYIFNVERLDQPRLQGTYQHPTAAIDHNNYVKGNRAFQSNYRSGLRILDTAQAEQGTLQTLGFFDVYPADDAAEFNGSWSNYPYFGSGNVIATGIEQGLFVLRPSDAISEGTSTPPPPEGGKPPKGEKPPKEDKPPKGDRPSKGPR